MFAYIQIDTNSSNNRDEIDHQVRYVSNQYGARIVKKSINELNDISYKLEIDDLDTYNKYARSLTRVFKKIPCEYVIKAFYKQVSWGNPVPVPVYSNYITSDTEDSGSDTDDDINDLKKLQMHPIYTMEYDGHNVY